MQKSLIIIFALFCLTVAVSGQSCGIVGTNETTLVINALTESTLGEVLIARLELFNVVSTSAVSSPHYKYVKALRYANGVYELWTEDIFKDFMSTERSLYIERSVNLKCNDDTTQRITFIIPVIDENDNAPTFNQLSYNVSIELPLIPTNPTTTVRTGIIVSDSDVDFQNADVYFASSNRRFAPLVTRLWTGEYPEVYSYQVDFLVDSTVEEGNYVTIVTADDNKTPTIAAVNIIVIAASPPQTEPTVAPPTNGTTTEATPEPEQTLPPSH